MTYYDIAYYDNRLGFWVPSRMQSCRIMSDLGEAVYISFNSYYELDMHWDNFYMDDPEDPKDWEDF